MRRGMRPWRVLGSRRRSLGDERGVALIEFALVLPLLLLIMFGMIDFGKAFNYWNDETHLANEAARDAVVNRSPDPNWAGDPTNPAYKINTAIRKQADSAELRNGGTQSISSPGVSICIWFPNNTDATDDPIRDHAVGDPVQVVVKAQYNWLAYLVGQGLPAHSDLTGTATMRLEQPYQANGHDAFTTGPASAPQTDASGTC
jgi:Flp pilus assembly protein TadG